MPRDKALTIRFLSIKYLDFASSLGGYSLIIKPLFSTIFFASSIFSSGKILFRPQPSTAIVLPGLRYENVCATVSIPFASPLTIVRPEVESSVANFFAIF